ncbi:hypothetical protein AJ79_02682 [Helicocarpus griseus UAMH5409]|uniref:Uncharacterized protein n=1 Tax=Helicocarpus griseus UAMH5409 TaxID=1447875 RepID=A0A2B7Y2B5_9EURO|nr:hypothetical protein AJ79_02682 [Helicocarpus griseus UAMH5409]
MALCRTRLPLIPIVWAAIFPFTLGLDPVYRHVLREYGIASPRLVARQDVIPGSIGDGETDRDWSSQPKKGSMYISQGAIIAIAVVVGIVVIIGITSVILFYLAKRRQWEVRASIRRSARRIAAPMTPRRFTAPPIPASSKTKNREASIRVPAQDITRPKHKISKQQSKSDGTGDKYTLRREMSRESDRDVEKAVDMKSPTGKSEFEPASPRGWRQIIPFGRTQ